MKYVIALGFVAVIVGVFAYTALFDSPGAANMNGEVEQADTINDSKDTTEVVSENRSGKSTLEALRQLGEDVECTISYEDESTGESVEGTFFIADGRTRGDFLTETPDLQGQALSSIILDGDMFYTWSEIEGQRYGMKMNTSVIENAGGQEPQQYVEMNKEVQYDCVPWQNVDNTVFVPPSDVLFQDFGAMIEAGMEYGTIYEQGAEMPY